MFLQYKKDYYTEQTYKLSYILSANMKGLLYTKENNELFQNVSNEFSTPIELLNKDLDEVLYSVDMDKSENKNPFYVDAPIISDGEMLGYLRAYYDLDHQIYSPTLTKFQKKLQDQQRHFVQVAVIVMLMSGFIIAKLLSKRIEAPAFAALQISQGRRDAVVPRSGTMEVKQLIDSINNLLVEFNNLENWRKQMMEDLTHELRTPLTTVLTTLEAIIDGVYPTTKENLQDIYDEVERLSRLIINVQELSEAEGARFKLNIQRVNIISLIKGTYEGFLFVAQHKDIIMQFNHPNRPCEADVDPDRLIQVVTNIISNALKYTPKGGKVEVGLESYEHEMVFYCIDDGPGISDQDQSLVFNRFYRTDKSRSRENGGTGIGLNISKALVEAHGGEVGVESELGHGSKFWVKIPINNIISS